MGLLYDQEEWIVYTEDTRLLIWREGRFIKEWNVQGIQDYQFYTAQDELIIIRNMGQELTRLRIKSEAPEKASEECALRTSFHIAQFQVMPTTGFILAYDKVAGVLHLFNSREERYQGFIKACPTQVVLSVHKPSEFQVFVRDFELASLVVNTYLNRYRLHGSHISLVNTIPMRGSFNKRWVVSNSCGNVFAVVSTSEYELKCQLEFFLDEASTPFHKESLDGHATSAAYVGPLKLILILHSMEGTTLCMVNLESSHAPQILPLVAESICSSHEVDKVGNISRLSSTLTTAHLNSKLKLANSSSTSIFFVMDSAPNTLFCWSFTKNIGSHLDTWKFPAKVVSLGEPNSAAIAAVCLNENPTSLSKIEISQPFSGP
ncbi:LAQU0S09e02234g1_1 [Lachancea quebecensis]|uniref:LAQU0S09e02234g1_1 n=1 Tax=Lachancea quebecensis TaxID=1654605 RepID=A0A0P1KTE7_9SACH|nr:LAQU0S09e02234g1_1 [Lachancea quebecensis]